MDLSGVNTYNPNDVGKVSFDESLDPTAPGFQVRQPHPQAPRSSQRSRLSFLSANALLSPLLLLLLLPLPLLMFDVLAAVLYS